MLHPFYGVAVAKFPVRPTQPLTMNHARISRVAKTAAQPVCSGVGAKGEAVPTD